MLEVAQFFFRNGVVRTGYTSWGGAFGFMRSLAVMPLTSQIAERPTSASMQRWR